MTESGPTNLLARALIMAILPVAATVSAAEPTYVAELDRIEADFRVARERCDDVRGHLGNVCVAEARAVRRIAKAELEARGKGTPKSWYDARIARAEAEFEVAKERCGERAGHAREQCIAEARAAEARAKANARQARSEAEARERPHAAGR